MSSIPDYSQFDYLGSAADFVEDIYDVFKCHTLLDDFSREECQILCEYMGCYAAPANAALLKQYDTGDFLLIILTGSVSVIKHHPDEAPTVVAQIGPGEFLGEMSFGDGKPRLATCTTSEPSDFAVFPHEALNGVLIDHPRLGNKLLLILMRVILMRFREATASMPPGSFGSLV